MRRLLAIPIVGIALAGCGQSKPHPSAATLACDRALAHAHAQTRNYLTGLTGVPLKTQRGLLEATYQADGDSAGYTCPHLP